jgi:hypothetical protein
MFPTTGVIDDFNRADENLSSGNWASPTYSGDIAPAVFSNQVRSSSSGSSFADAYWAATTFGPDCEAYFTISTLPSGTEIIYLDIRIQSPGTSGMDCYEVVWDASSATARIYRIDDGTNTLLGSTVSVAYNAGDGYGFGVIGSSITLYRRVSGVWSSQATRTDSTYSSAGNIGLGCQAQTVRLDDFGGGTVVLSRQNLLLLGVG